jgi:3-oxosteroid 1-dehydrogenase
MSDGFDEEFDWVVVGSGAGAFSSALVMLQAKRSVVVLEKTALAGGTTAKSGGVMWIPNNRFMHAEGERDSTEAATTYLDALQVLDGGEAPGSTPEKRLAYVTQAPRAVDFLVQQGVALERGPRFYPDYYDELPGSCKTTRTVVAKPFNLNELGPLSGKLRAGFAPFHASLGEGMEVGHSRTNPNAKRLLARIAFRTVIDKLLGRKFTTAGAALQGRMLKAALAAGVDLRLDTPVDGLIIEDGSARGVTILRDGKPWRIGARLGVLVNAGGFAHNQEMRDKYMPGTRSDLSQTPEGDTGDMHLELERIGGVLAQMDQMVGFPMTPAPGYEKRYVMPPIQGTAAKPHAILVDQSGERYMNEGGSYELFCETMLKRNRTVPAVPSYAIFDSQHTALYKIADKFIDNGVPAEWLSAGYIKQADTIEGLASQLSMEPAKLAATVARWNGFVANGKDEDFARGERRFDNCGFMGDPFSEASSLGTIAKGPFFAVPAVPGDVSTYGGVVTNPDGLVVKADGTVIHRLYATGTTTASVMGNVYSGAGASVGPSMTFGYIAARHAAGINEAA